MNSSIHFCCLKLLMLILSGMLQPSYINNERNFNKPQFHCYVADDLWPTVYAKKQPSSGNNCMDEYNITSELNALNASLASTAKIQLVVVLCPILMLWCFEKNFNHRPAFLICLVTLTKLLFFSCQVDYVISVAFRQILFVFKRDNCCNKLQCWYLTFESSGSHDVFVLRSSCLAFLKTTFCHCDSSFPVTINHINRPTNNFQSIKTGPLRKLHNLRLM